MGSLYHTCNLPHFFSYASRKLQTHLLVKLFLWRVVNKMLATLQQNLETETYIDTIQGAYSYSLQIYLKFISCISFHDMDEFISSLHLSHHLSNIIVFYGSCLDCGNQIELSGANNLTSKELTIAYYISLLVKCWNSKKMKL